MSSQEDWQAIILMSETYTRMVRAELSERWEKWSLDLSNREMYEVIGALLARQVTLATQLASVPSMWNPHIAPMILRTMTEGYITLAWIFIDPEDRSKKFILYGLGQTKLQIEHRKVDLQSQRMDPNDDPIIEAMERWVNSQRYTFLTEVNVGSWSGIDIRTMSQEAGCKNLYDFAYVPFSAATHSMWQHISKYNLITCTNPLHGYHRVPIDSPDMLIEPDFLYRAAKYVQESFTLFDANTSITVSTPSAFNALVEALKEFGEENNSTAEQPSTGATEHTE